MKNRIFYNNLLIKLNDNFLLINLLSFRRRILSENEQETIFRMLSKESPTTYDESEMNLYNALQNEGQIISKDKRELFEKNAEEYSTKSEVEYKHFITIQITEECNMNCHYCYEKSYKNSASMTYAQIDSIKLFYEALEKEYNINLPIPIIAITGGEPLLDLSTIDKIKHISEIWDKSEIKIMSNAINLMKYKDLLPMDRITEFFISLDGTDKVHMQRRYKGQFDIKIYNNIIESIKYLLSQNIKVALNVIVDNDNINSMKEFLDFLKNEDIDINKVNLRIAPVLDFMDELGIDSNFNNKFDVINNTKQLANIGLNIELIGELSRLKSCVFRDYNTKFEHKFCRCNTSIGSRCFFSPNGNVYFCNRINTEKGIIGTFDPQISFNHALINSLSNRTIYNDAKCKVCEYKFVCLGGFHQ